MAIPQLAQTAMKVDQAVARLQKLQSTVSGKNGKHASPKKKTRCNDLSRAQRKAFHELAGLKEAPESLGDHWRRWSLPAEFVHQAISEIKLANNYAKEVAGIMVNTKKDNAQYATKISERETGIEDTSRVIPSRLNNKEVLDSTNRMRRQNNRIMAHKALEREEAGRRRRDALVNEKFPRTRGKSSFETQRAFTGHTLANEQFPRTRQKNPSKIQTSVTGEALANEKFPRTRGKNSSTTQRVLTPMKTSDVKKRTQILLGRGGEKDDRFSPPFPSISSAREMVVRQGAMTKDKHNPDLELPAIQRQVPHTAGLKKVATTIIHSPSSTPKMSSKLRSLRSARVSNSLQSPPMAIGKLAISVTEIPTSHRPWSLTPGRSSKPIVMFPNPAFTPCRSTATKLPPSLTFDSSKNKLRDLKLTLSVAEVSTLSVGKKPDLPKAGSENDKKNPPQVMPTEEPMTEKKQGWLSKRLSMTPPRSISKILLLDKRDRSSVKSLPSLITRLPARRRENDCLPSRGKSTATAKNVSGLDKSMAKMEQDTMFPLPIPPALHAEELREAQRNKGANYAQSTCKNSISHSPQFRPINGNLMPTFQSERSRYPSKGKENSIPGKMEHEKRDMDLKDCALPFSGCSATVWPVLRRSWSFGNERHIKSSASKSVSGSFVLKTMKRRATISKAQALLG